MLCTALWCCSTTLSRELLTSDSLVPAVTTVHDIQFTAVTVPSSLLLLHCKLTFHHRCLTSYDCGGMSVHKRCFVCLPFPASFSRCQKHWNVPIESLFCSIVLSVSACRFKGRWFEFVFVLLLPALFTYCSLKGHGSEEGCVSSVISILDRVAE